MASFFISHASCDREAAARVRTWLEREGFTSVFLDFDPETGIPPGRQWERELYSQLRRADVLLFLGTRAAGRSSWCHTELAMSRALGRTILPLQLEPGASHPLVEDRQWLSISLNGEASLAPLGKALAGLQLDALDTLEWDTSLSPYPGLEHFDEDRAGVFFGRDDTIRSVLDELRRPKAQGAERLLLVAGASGAGKSSLVLSGVVPRLRRLQPAWIFVPTVAPADAPLEQLARSLAVCATGQVGERLRRDGLAAVARDLVAGVRGDPCVLLVLDQAEQLVTQCSPGRRVAFMRLLAEGLAAGSPLRVVATLRSEYLGELLAGTPLEGAPAPVVTIGRLSAERIAEVIAEPARRAGIDLEPGLVDRMVVETRSPTGGDPLPLLAFTLRQLYERRANSTRITLVDYERVGGVVGALKAEADRTLAQLEREGLGDAVVPTLLELAHVDPEREAAGRTVQRAGFDGAANRVLDAFVEARLLTSSEDEPSVGVAHEALLREWGLLARAIDGSRDRLVARTRLERDAREWDLAGREPSYLAAGRRLEEAEAALGGVPDPAAAAFVAASRRRARRQAWRGRAVTTLVVGVVVAGLGAVAVLGLRRLRESQDRDAARARLVPVPGAGAVDEHEVTNAQYGLCVRWGACTSPPATGARPEFASTAGTAPIVMVDAGQAAAFCAWIGRVLPDVATLERAAAVPGVTYLLEEPGGQAWTSATNGAARVTVRRNADGSTVRADVNPSQRDFDLVLRCAQA